MTLTVLPTCAHPITIILLQGAWRRLRPLALPAHRLAGVATHQRQRGRPSGRLGCRRRRQRWGVDFLSFCSPCILATPLYSSFARPNPDSFTAVGGILAALLMQGRGVPCGVRAAPTMVANGCVKASPLLVCVQSSTLATGRHHCACAALRPPAVATMACASAVTVLAPARVKALLRG